MKRFCLGEETLKMRFGSLYNPWGYFVEDEAQLQQKVEFMKNLVSEYVDELTQQQQLSDNIERHRELKLNEEQKDWFEKIFG